MAFAVLFPRPWAPLVRHRWLLSVVCAAPLALVVACGLAELPGVGLTQWVGRVIAAETSVSVAMLGTGIVLGMVRYLTATDPIGRQQLKWLAGGAFVSGTLALVVWFLPEPVFGESLLPAAWLGFSGLPLVAGLTVAILRYRLFDVDRIISRTAYGLLTLLLGGGYAAVVLALGQLLGHQSSLVVAAATLAVAEQTMQPTQVSLWLRPQAGRLARPAPDPPGPRSWSARSFRAPIATGASPFRAGGDARPPSARDQTRPD